MASEKLILPNWILVELFKHEWTGFILAVALVLWACWIIWQTRRKHFSPLQQALRIRLDATEVIAGQVSEEAAQAAFSSHFDSIQAAMMDTQGESAELRHAWAQFRETIIDENQAVMAATARPEGYFLHIGDDSRVLAWWANIFVAVGLTATFLGIIAALAGAVDTIDRAGVDMKEMQDGLTKLLTMTATKFWTSIGGVGASILLRRIDRNWHTQTDQMLERLCERLEYGTRFTPPQRIAALQLRELEQQSVALTEFSHQLAASIGDALGQHFQPVVAGLSGIQSSLNEFKDGSFNQIGRELGDAISKNAGLEMQALAGALTSMTTGIQGVNDRLEGASGQASEQIATAAREFSLASAAMTTAFSTLNGSIDTMATRLTAQAEAAEQRAQDRVREEQENYRAMTEAQREALRLSGKELGEASAAAAGDMVNAVRDAIGGAMSESTRAISTALEGFAGATAGIQSAFDQMKGQVAELGDKLSGSASVAADRNAEVLARAAEALEGATAKAQAGMGAALDDAIDRSGKAASRAITEAFATFGARFTEASQGLVTTLNSTAGRMEALAQSIERSTGAANDHAGKLTTAGREAEAVGIMLGKAANDVSGAAAPIREAVAAIRDTVGQSGEMLRQAAEGSARQQQLIEAAATALEGTGTSATKAWEGYSARFAEVDKSLAEALDRIRGASAEHATALNAEVGRMDTALANAVGRLAPALDVLKELAEALDDVRGRFEAGAGG